MNKQSIPAAFKAGQIVRVRNGKKESTGTIQENDRGLLTIEFEGDLWQCVENDVKDGVVRYMDLSEVTP